MSDLKNNVQFEPQEPLQYFRGAYKDPNGSRWRIDLIGPAKQVEQFVAEQPFSLVATWLTPNEADNLKKKLAGRKQEPSAGPDPAIIVKQFPVLQVTYALVEFPQTGQPYHVQFKLDPVPPRSDDFWLFGTDTTANVNYQADSGTVWVNLRTPNGSVWDGPKAVGTVAISGVQPGRECTVSVYTATGNPSYTLDGDILVF